MRLTSVTARMTIQDNPDATVLLNKMQVAILTKALCSVDSDEIAKDEERRAFFDLRQSFSQLNAVLSGALVYFK